MAGRKRKRGRERAAIHPRNKYSENPPDFGLLASLYPTFLPFVFYSRDGRPRIDWKDYNATRELTRVLLLHDHGLNWWIPDGQLCPTVPNRSNYIHWIEDLLSSEIIVDNRPDGGAVRGFDIGTGANCIYPLLGTSLLGWRFVGSDVSEVALEWAEKNVKSNPHISGLIEIRKVENNEEVGLQIEDIRDSESNIHNLDDACSGTSVSCPAELHSTVKMSYRGPPILVGVVKDEEKFDFCMCNPPFFETMEEAGLNPKTACGGTSKEMVCPGGEQAFITRIIEDSMKLKQSFRWYTSMVGRKSNLKILISKLRAVGVTIVKTTEFVQGQTCRWGLAWSFVPPSRKISSHAAENNNMSFMLEGIQKQYSALHVLQTVEIFFSSMGASCKLNTYSFTIDIMVSEHQCGGVLVNEAQDTLSGGSFAEKSGISACPNSLNSEDLLHLSVSVFQQIPGTLLIKGSLQQKESSGSGKVFPLFCNLEEVLRNKFCKTKAIPGSTTSEQKIR